MSKQLAKLLSICALIVLLPFVVIGTALTFTEAVGVTLSIAQVGLNGQYTSAAEAGIYIDGQKQEDTIEVKKNKTVELVFQGEGYHFYGWYEGEAGSIVKGSDKGRVSTQEKFKYVVSENKAVTAVRDVQKYNIQYEGTNFDGTALTTTSQENVEYGARLPELEGGTQLFRGWKIKDSANEPVFIAKFEADDAVEEITLEPVWKTDFNFPVYFNINDESAENAVSLTYNAATGLVRYQKTRDNFTFAGLKIAGVDKVFSEYKTTNGFSDYTTSAGESMYETLKLNPTAKTYAVWNSIYAPFTFNYEAVAYYAGAVTGENSYWAVFNDVNGDGILTEDEAYVNTTMKEYVFSDETKLAIEDNIVDVVLGDTSNLVTRAKNDKNEFVPGQKVEFANKVVVEVAGQYGYVYNVIFDETYPCTFENVMNDVLLGLEIDGVTLDTNQINTYSFEISFIFEVVA